MSTLHVSAPEGQLEEPRQVLEGREWLLQQVPKDAPPARGNYNHKKLQEEVVLQFCGETLTLPVDTTFTLFKKNRSSPKRWTFATIFIAATSDQPKRQISVLSDGSLQESRLERRIQPRRHVSTGMAFIRAAH